MPSDVRPYLVRRPEIHERCVAQEVGDSGSVDVSVSGSESEDERISGKGLEARQDKVAAISVHRTIPGL